MRRELLRVAGNEVIGPYVLLLLERGGLEPGVPGQFFMVEAPGRLLPRAFSLCLAPPNELGFLFEPVGPGTRALAGLAAGDAIHVMGPLGNGFDLDVERPLLVGGGIGIAPLPVPLRASRRPAGAPRLPQHAPRRGGVARAERGGGARPDARDGRPARETRATSSPAGPSRCSTRSRRSSPARSSPARRRWPAGTGRATAASSRGTAATSASASRAPCLTATAAAQSMSVPILNASGCLDALAAPDVARALDAFVTKTITPLPREGNPPTRIAETDHGMLNSIGLQGPGIDAFVAEHLPRLAEIVPQLWVSVGGFSAADFTTCCERLDGDGRVAAIELNLSCPNVEEAPETAAQLVAAARSATSLPLYAKLSPAQWDIAEAARAVVDAGADGLSLVNTIRGLALDPVTLRPILARGAGGYSGPALRPIALACVHACASAVDVPIVGMGGVSSGRDALELVAVGAGAVAVGTALFSDPGAPGRVRAELAAEAAARGFETPRDLRGVVQTEKSL